MIKGPRLDIEVKPRSCELHAQSLSQHPPIDLIKSWSEDYIKLLRGGCECLQLCWGVVEVRDESAGRYNSSNARRLMLGSE
jgi:hypothetical protein